MENIPQRIVFSFFVVSQSSLILNSVFNWKNTFVALRDHLHAALANHRAWPLFFLL